MRDLTPPEIAALWLIAAAILSVMAVGVPRLLRRMLRAVARPAKPSAQPSEPEMLDYTAWLKTPPPPQIIGCRQCGLVQWYRAPSWRAPLPQHCGSPMDDCSATVTSCVPDPGSVYVAPGRIDWDDVVRLWTEGPPAQMVDMD